MVAVEQSSWQAELGRELVEFIQGVVTDEMAPAPLTAMPQQLVDEQRHETTGYEVRRSPAAKALTRVRSGVGLSGVDESGRAPGSATHDASAHARTQPRSNRFRRPQRSRRVLKR